MKQRFRSGGLAAWSIHHPIATTMLALTVIVLGIFSLERLNIDLLPKIIYPEVRVRILQPGVPAAIMEDQITRQLEEQLAITENATSVQSESMQGRSSVNLSFPYGTDIDVALRDASTRLDRARRYLPTNIEPPVIFKRDPSQIPVMELVVSSNTRDPVALRSWVDYVFSKWFLNIKGVAATEVGGGLIREINVILDAEKLSAAGLSYQDIINTFKQQNLDIASGVFYGRNHQYSTRVLGRFTSVEDIARLPLENKKNPGSIGLHLSDVARVVDTHEDEKFRVRLNGIQGVKMSIQKQPGANTVAVVDDVEKQLRWMQQQHLIPADIQVAKVGDQSVYIRSALHNTAMAALYGALLSTFIVFLFLGDVRKTLIVSSVIPLAVLITFSIMQVSGLTLNIMSLGGLAMGIGILLDNTIVMLENISRHQLDNPDQQAAATEAAGEITSAITASTSTNIVAVLPFLFIGGLIGLIFNELIITLTAATLASLIVALTVVPVLSTYLHSRKLHGDPGWLIRIRDQYKKLLLPVIRHPFILLLIMSTLLAYGLYSLSHAKEAFFPTMDEGRIQIGVTAEPGTQLNDLDQYIKTIESMLEQDPVVKTVYTLSGGFIFGRSEYERSNRGSVDVQLIPLSQRNISSSDWARKIEKQIRNLPVTGFRTTVWVSSVRGIRISRGDDDVSIRVKGEDLEQLSQAGDAIVKRISDIPGLKNIEHTYQEKINEMVLKINRERAAALNITAEEIGQAMQLALDGSIVSSFIDADRQFNIRMRMNPHSQHTRQDLLDTILTIRDQQPIRLADVASIDIVPAPISIQRDGQQRIVEVSASLKDGATIEQVMQQVYARLADLQLPDGYTLYDGGSLELIQQGKQTGYELVLLAVFLVIVVMAIQYESLINPFLIIFAAIFSLTGVAFGIDLFLNGVSSMPAKIGIIMLVGIVVNNSIVLIEQIEILREQGNELLAAVIRAAELRFRPILMTTLTTVMGMLPIAIGLGEGSELLQPLASVVATGLSYAMLVSLILVPTVYYYTHRRLHV